MKTKDELNALKSKMKQLAADICRTVAPIRERIKEISSDSDRLNKIAQLGAEKARESANKTLQEVRNIIGFHKIAYK